MNYYLGIDIGSYESKGMLIDEAGRLLLSANCAHQMEIPHPGYAEHDAEKTWWYDFCYLSRKLIQETGVDPKNIRGVGASAIAPCCLPVDQQGQPLRKAILYGVDVRAKKQIDDLNFKMGEQYILKKYGNPVTSQSVGPKILWIKENEPDVYKKTAKFVTSTTYLVAKLTGRWCIDRYTAAYFTPMYHLENQDWDYENIGEFCREDQLAECLWTDEMAGTVTKKAAEETGLAEGTPVIVGTADAAADAAGAGIQNDGDLLLMFGSSLYMIHVVPRLTTDARYWAGPYLFQDTYMVASGMSTAGMVTRWFRDQLALDLLQRESISGENAYDALMKEMDGIGPGSDGLIVLPYFSGERTPINDPQAKGMVLGLTLSHRRGHLYQACLEGIAYGIQQHLQGYREIGMETKRIVAVGGGTRTPKWMQIVADVTGREIEIGSVYGASFGDALLAARADGAPCGIQQPERPAASQQVVKPERKSHMDYRPYVENYKKLYLLNREIMHAL